MTNKHNPIECPSQVPYVVLTVSTAAGYDLLIKCYQVSTNNLVRPLNLKSDNQAW